MNKSLRKMLTFSSALLMFAGVGASASNIVAPAHASRISRLEAREKRDYSDIRSIKAQLAKLQHKHVRRHARRARKHTTRRAKHYRKYSGEWFYHNARKIYNRYRDDSNMYYDGSSDAWDSANLNPNKYYNPIYHESWVIVKTNGFSTPSVANGGTAEGYSQANDIYNQGVRYIKAHHSHHMINYGDNNRWEKADD